MRLIDADALSDEMYHLAFETDSDMQKWDGGCWIRYKMFEQCRDNAPTIEAEPVRHGRWVNKNNGKWNTLPVFMCSECGDYDPRLYGNENYCPNCGAKMDE